MKDKDIEDHPLLSAGEKVIARALVRASRREKSRFEMLDFAETALRAAGVNYSELRDDDVVVKIMADRDHKRAAILFVYEAIQEMPGGTRTVLGALIALHESIPESSPFDLDEGD